MYPNYSKTFLDLEDVLSEKWFRPTLLSRSISKHILPISPVLIVVVKQGGFMTTGYKKYRMFLCRENMSLLFFGKGAIHVFLAVNDS